MRKKSGQKFDIIPFLYNIKYSDFLLFNCENMSGRNLEAKNIIEEDEIREWLNWLKQEVSKLYEKPEEIEGRNLYEELKNFNFEQIFEYTQWKDKRLKRIKPWVEKRDEYWKYIEINGEKYYDSREILSGLNKKRNEKILTYRIIDSKHGTSVQLYELDENYHLNGTWLVVKFYQNQIQKTELKNF